MLPNVWDVLCRDIFFFTFSLAPPLSDARALAPSPSTHFIFLFIEEFRLIKIMHPFNSVVFVCVDDVRIFIYLFLAVVHFALSLGMVLSLEMNSVTIYYLISTQAFAPNVPLKYHIFLSFFSSSLDSTAHKIIFLAIGIFFLVFFLLLPSFFSE